MLSRSPAGWESLLSALGNISVDCFSSLSIVPAYGVSDQAQKHWWQNILSACRRHTVCAIECVGKLLTVNWPFPRSPVC